MTYFPESRDLELKIDPPFARGGKSELLGKRWLDKSLFFFQLQGVLEVQGRLACPHANNCYLASVSSTDVS